MALKNWLRSLRKRKTNGSEATGRRRLWGARIRPVVEWLEDRLAPATHFAISAPASVTAGNAFSITVTALQADNSVDTGYGGTVHFTKTDSGTGSSVPADYTFLPGDNGVHTFTNGVTFVTAGNQTVTATDTSDGSITGTSNSISVSPAAATHFAVSAPSSATAGSAFLFTVTAQDQFNNTATSYSGTVHFTSTDGAATLPADSTLSNGTGTFSATLRTAGNQTITATDTVTSSITGTSNSISVSPAAATHFAVSAPSSATAGSAFNFTVTALDQFNNTATGYGGTVHFTTSAGAATLPADSPLSNGTGTFSATLDTAGNQTVTATDTNNSSITGTSNTIAVSAAAADHLAFGVQPSSTTAGAIISPAVTVRVLDRFNNLVATDTSNVTVAIGTNPGGGTLSGTTTEAAAGGVATFSTLSIDKAGQGYTLTAADGSLGAATSTAFNITPAAADHLAFGVEPSDTTAGAAISPAVTVRVLDRFNNLVATDTSNVTVALGANPGGGTLAGTTTEAASGGVATFGDLLIDKAGQGYTLTAADGNLGAATSTAFNITPAAATHFAVSAPSSATAGSAFNFTVTALDQFTNVATGYGGTVHFTSTDGAATLPADSTLSNGTGTFSATLRTAGNQTIAATDTNNSSISGTSNTITVSSVMTSADVQVTKTGPAAVTAGDQITYTISFVNAGPSDAPSAVLTDSVPSGTAFVSFTAPAGWTVTNQPAPGGTGLVRATDPDVVAGAGPQVFTLIVATDPNAAGPSTVTNTASGLSGAADPNTNNNDSTVTTSVSTSADLALTKTDNPDPVFAGANITYTIGLTNNGPNPAQNVSLTDNIPLGTAFVSFTAPAGWNSTTPTAGNAGTVTSTSTSVANGANPVFTLVVSVAPNTPDNSTITNTANVASTTADPNNTNNTATATTTVNTQADLVVTKSGPATAVAGTTFTYTLTLSNSGPSDAQNVVVTDTVPGDETIVFVQGFASNGVPSGATVNGNVVTFTPGSVPAGDPGTVIAQIAVSTNEATVANGTQVTNSATATTTTAESNSQNNTGSVTTTFTNQADLSVTKTTAQTTATPGTNVTYTITLHNLGPNTARGVSLTDAVPANTTFVSAAPVAGQNPDGFSYSLSGGTVTGTPTGGTVASGNTDQLLLVVNVNPGTPANTTITNSATASMNSTIVVDPNAGNNTGTATTVTSAPSADVVVTKAGPATVFAGQNITYTVTVADNGPSDATSVQFTDTVPANTSFVSASSTQGTVTQTGGVISGNLGTVTTTAPVTVTIVVSTAPSLASGTITNAATAFGSTADPNTGNNTGTASTTVQTSADLAVTKTTAQTTVTPGTDITYTVSVTNSGPSDAQSVSLTDNTPPNTVFVSQSQTAGPAFTLSDPGAGNPGTISDTLATLPSGASAVLQFVVKANSGTPVNTTITNTATVASPTDTNTANNSSSATTTTANASADLVITKNAPATAVVGTTYTFTITASNAGPSDATSVTVTDQLPPQLVFQGGTSTQGSGVVNSAGVLTISFGTIAAGGTATATITVQVTANTPNGSTINNTASGSANQADPNTLNNSSTASTTVQTSADLSVAKTGPANATAGTNVTYTVTLTNAGPSDAQGVVFTDNIPAGTTFVSETQTGGVTFAFPNNPQPGSSSGTIFGQATTLAVGQTATFVLVFHANASDASGSTVSNTAVVSSSTSDPNGGNNASTADTTINTSADLVMTKTGTASADAGTNVTYTLAVSNAGPSDAQNVSVSDTLPAGETFVSASTGSGSGTSYSSGNLGTLAFGGTFTITIVAHISPSQPGGTLTDTATASSSTPDANGTNNTATFGTTVTTSADVAVTKVGPATVTAGTDVTYTITTTNNGPSDAQAVITSDTPPPNTSLVSFVQDSGPPNAGTLPAGGIQTFTLILHLNANQPSGSTVTNQANVSSTTTDPNSSNNVSTVNSTVQTSADLSLTKSGPATAIAGTQVTYTLVVSNSGPSDAQGVTVTDTLPTGTAFVSASEGSGSGTSYTDPVGTLAFGATRTITVVALVNPNVGDNTSLTDSATVTSSTADPNAGNNTGTATTVIHTSADLAVTKSGPATGVAGTNVTYTIVVSNGGPSDAQTVSVTDTLPVGETFVSASTGSGSGTLYFSGNLGTLAAGASTTLTLVAHISPSVPNTTALTDSATASSSTPDPNATNNTATFNTTVSTSADLSLVKTGPATATAGTNVTYTLTVSNAGPSDAQAVTVTDTLPTGETFVSASVGTGAGTSYNSGSLGTLAFGATTTITLVARISPSVGSNTALTNSATAGSTTPDPNGTNNTGTFVTTVTTSADLSVTKSGPAAATAGTDLTYTITASNAGPSDSQGVTLTDTLPAGETFVSLTTPSGFTSTTPPVGSGGTVTSSDPTLAAGASGVFTLVVHLSASAPANSTVTNTATVASIGGTPDPNGGNNASSTSLTVNTSADLAVTKTGPATAVAGTDLTYTVTVSNAGPSDAQGVSLTDTLPNGETFVSATASQGSATQTGGVVTAALGTVANGGFATLTLVAHVSPSVPDGTTITNAATASSGTLDTTPGNNTGTTTTTVQARADLAVTKSGTPNPVTAGTDLTYTVTVSNAGPSDAQGVSLTDTLPANTTFVSATATQGTVTNSGGTVTDTVGTMAAGATVTLTVVAHVASSAPNGSTLTNSATATATTTDPNAGNNTGTASTVVQTSADLAISKTASPNPPTAGQNLTYTITVSDIGPSDAQAVTVTDSLPAGVTFVSATPSQGTATNSGGVVTANLGTVTSGSAPTITVVVAVPASTANNTTLTETASVTSTTSDPNAGNNTVTNTSTVVTRADLALTIGTPPNPVTAGTNLTFTLTVTNSGPSDAQAATVTDAVPSNTTFLSATASQGTAGASGGVVTGNLGTLAAGGSATVVITLKVNSSAPDGSTITDTAAVTTTTTDPNGSNNFATVSTTVTTSADLIITKTFSPNPPAGFANLTYTITVANAGPSDSQSTVVTDALPSGTVFQSVTVSQGTASDSGGTVTANLGAVTAGTNATVTVVVNVPPGTVNGTTLTNTASVSSTTPDPNPANNSVTVSGKVIAPSAVGVFDGQAQYGDPPATWKLRNSNQPGAPDITPFQYGSPTSTPVMGDWDGNGTTTVGVVDVANGQLVWKLRNSNTTGAADITFAYGVQGDIPVVGDWNGDGTTTIGIVDVVPDPNNPGGQALRWQLRNTNGAGAPDITFLYGIPGDIPVTGDWNGDHITTIGVVRPNTTTGVLTWFLRNSNSAGNPDIAPFAYGAVGNTPVTGDWNADGVTTVGVYDPVFAGWKLRNSNTAGAPDIAPPAGFAYGSPNGLSQPVTGQYGPSGLLARALDGARPNSGAAPLSQADLQQTVTAALDRLSAAGVSASLLGRLAQAQFTVGTLTTGTVGAAFPSLNRVVMDATAAGHGWFVDPTPLQDEEFTPTPQGALAALPGTAAQGREDLLTAVLHELGHIAGLADTDAIGTLMGGYLPDGTRLTAALDRIFARGNF